MKHLPVRRAAEVAEGQVRAALLRMDTTSSSGPDAMSVRLLRLLLLDVALVGPNQNGLTILTDFINLAIGGRLPPAVHQLYASARLVALPKGPGKIRPVAVGTVLRRLISKAAMPLALDECRDYLQPYQLANATPCGIDAIVHRARELIRLHGGDSKLAHVAVDAKNAFNLVERQEMLEATREHIPSIARWVFYIYATEDPQLVSTGGIIASAQGTQQGDPLSMLLFSLAINDLVRRVGQECNLMLNAWYADDAHLIGSIDQIGKALRLIREEGPRVNYLLQPAKSEIYWPTSATAPRKRLLRQFPMKQLTSGMTMLGAPVGSVQFMQESLHELVNENDAALNNLDRLAHTGHLDARIPYMLHRACLGQSRLNHAMRLTPPAICAPALRRADERCMYWFQRFNDLSLTPESTQQVSLPISMGGHGFLSAALLSDAAYLGSLVDVSRHEHLFDYGHPDPGPRDGAASSSAIPLSFTAQAKDSYDLFAERHPPHVNDECEHPMDLALDADDMPPTAKMQRLPPFPDLLQNAKRTQHKLSRVLLSNIAQDLWREQEWAQATHYGGPEHELQSWRARMQSIASPGASAFLIATPTRTTRLNRRIWSIMLCRHLGLKVYDDGQRPLHCSHCGKPMDAQGVHATESCRVGWSQLHRHNAMQRTWAYEVLRPAGCSTSFEEPLLIPGTQARPADVFVPVPPGASHTDAHAQRPIAYDITVRATLGGEGTRLLRAATHVGGAASQGESVKRLQFNRKLANASSTNTRAFTPHWRFSPIGFDSFGALGANTRKELKSLLPRIAKRTHCTVGAATQNIYNSLSYTLWTSAAVAVLSRQPVHGTTPPRSDAHVREAC